MNRMKKIETKAAKAPQASQGTIAAARQAMREYTFLIEPDEELGFVGSAMEMPTVMSDGRSRNECVADLEFALETALGAMVEQGKPLPDPVSSATRSEQVNIRLTAREKQLLLLESN